MVGLRNDCHFGKVILSFAKTTNEKPPSSRWVSLTKRCAVSNSRGLLMDAVAIEMRLRTKGI